MQTLTQQDFEQWLRAYGSAWKGRDAPAATRLFTAGAEYYWTPLDPPQRGHAEIAAAWQGAVSQQRDVKFTSEVLAVTGATGIARWRADFVRTTDAMQVRIEGVLTAEFAEPGQCRVFREWWHSAEAAG